MIDYEKTLQKTHVGDKLTQEEQVWFRENLLRLRRALLFYANATNYGGGAGISAVEDRGAIARAALTTLHKKAKP